MSETTTLPSAPATSSRYALMIVFLVVVIDLLGFGIVLPLLPRLGNDYLKDLFAEGAKGAAGGALLGLLMASFSLMQFLFAPAWGRLSDRIGRRPVLLVGLAGSVVFYALLGYALSLPADNAVLALVLLFAARIGAGIAGATIATAQAVIADCTPPEKRKHGMALIGAAFGIGFTLGPIIGGVALPFFPGKHWLVGAIASVLSLGALLFGLVRLPETLQTGGHRAARKLINFDAIRWALSTSAIAPVVWTFFLASLGFASFEVTLSLLVGDSLELDEAHTFWIFAFVGMVLMLTQGFLYRRLANRVSEATFMAMGLALMGLGVLALGGVSWLASQPDRPAFAPLLGLTLPVLAVSVVGFAFLTPSAQALVSRRSPADRQGEILGVNQSASAMARILGPVCGLALYKATATHLLPYVFGSALLLLMLPLIPRIRRSDGTFVLSDYIEQALRSTSPSTELHSLTTRLIQQGRSVSAIRADLEQVQERLRAAHRERELTAITEVIASLGQNA